MAQLKFVLDDDLVKKFKQIVIAKHGKIELSSEGEEAIRLYVNKYEHALTKSKQEADPLKRVIGAIKSPKPSDALEDLKRLETGEFRSS
ncbi:MAG: hypothetical protein E6K95_00785 [Thaumarchaeota archaeon]|nr:MAG: hypothetical protein E6K95_00785 [Nitrososphaerota archaeon]TLY16789.1 MAG: hypothetical protein E6K86_03390 [Nitrososphaerota archaeon]TMP99921.1 MAG: hypothetical protein E6K99_03665 [Nitrososphaerota archaeon]